MYLSVFASLTIFIFSVKIIQFHWILQVIFFVILVFKLISIDNLNVIILQFCFTDYGNCSEKSRRNVLD